MIMQKSKSIRRSSRADNMSLTQEYQMRKKCTSRRNMLIICAMCIVLLGLIGTYYLTDYLDFAHVNNYPMAYEDVIDKYADEYQLDSALVCAVVYTESKFDANAVSQDGACGLMQVMPETGEWIAGKLGISDTYTSDMLFDPDTNVRFGCWYLNFLFTRYQGDTRKTLAAYNAGQGNVDKWLTQPECSSDGVSLDHIPFRETRNYVKKVKAAHDIYIDLYYSDKAA